jgi:hypothetical protein
VLAVIVIKTLNANQAFAFHMANNAYRIVTYNYQIDNLMAALAIRIPNALPSHADNIDFGQS